MCGKRDHIFKTSFYDAALREHRWCNGIMRDSHSRDPGSIPGRCIKIFFTRFKIYFHTR